MGQRVSRRTFLTASAIGAAGAAASTPALGGHWPNGNTPPAHQPGQTGGQDEGDAPTPKDLPDLPYAPAKTEHDRGDAVITRYQGNLEANDFGCWGDMRTGLIYVTQRATDRIAVFDRAKEEFVEVHTIPTDGSGAHAIRVDERTNSVWTTHGEASKVGRLVLDPETLRPHNFAEYTMPGDVRPERKPHGVAVHRGEVWFTDDRGDRVGVLDPSTGFVHVIDHHVEADGITVEQRRRSKGFRVWVTGGNMVTVIDGPSREVLHEVQVKEEPGFSQLRLHDLVYDPELNRTWILSRGSDHVVWFDADDPRAGPKEFINPGETAAGLDHVALGRYLWWTEGLQNNLTRYDRHSKEKKVYEVPVPVGYFNPHGLWVAHRWREVWFTERESLCKLTFKDGRAP
jgi:DNA-binding beta-propeller fold protein YncE